MSVRITCDLRDLEQLAIALLNEGTFHPAEEGSADQSRLGIQVEQLKVKTGELEQQVQNLRYRFKIGEEPSTGFLFPERFSRLKRLRLHCENVKDFLGRMEVLIKTLREELDLVGVSYQTVKKVLEDRVLVEAVNDAYESGVAAALRAELSYFRFFLGLASTADAAGLERYAAAKELLIRMKRLSPEWFLIAVVAGASGENQLRQLLDQIGAVPFGLIYLNAWLEGLENVKKILRIMAGAIEGSGGVAVVSGFVPERFLTRLRIRLRAIPGVRLEAKTAKEGPVFLESPFRSVLYMYGIPAPGAASPIPVITITFPLFFGFMFADVGHGLVLSLISVYLIATRVLKYRDWGYILFLSGLSSIGFGLLQGHIFGFSFLYERFGVEPYLSIYSNKGLSSDRIFFILGLSLLIGIVHQLMSMSFELHDSIRIGDLGYALGKVLPTIVIYVAGIVFIASTSYLGRMISPEVGKIALYIVLASVLLIIVGRPSTIVYNLLDAMLLVPKLTSNTISYIRIALFFMLHTILLTLLNQALSLGILAIPILVVGNLGIIIFEASLAFIQTLRLHLYEFLSRFFAEGGEEFAPLRLDATRSRISFGSAILAGRIRERFEPQVGGKKQSRSSLNAQS